MHSVYMDYNATTPIAESVKEAITYSISKHWANPSSSYQSGQECKLVIENARKSISEMISCLPCDIIFTSGGTEANALVLHTMSMYPTNTKLPHIITSSIEHDSVALTLRQLEKLGLVDVTYVPVSPDTGAVCVNDVVKSITPNTILITIMLANNETGAIQPIKEICDSVRKNEKFSRVLLHTDAAQAIGKIAVSVQELGVDYLTIVGHKFYGPRIGALYVRNLSTTPLKPMMFGGSQERCFRPGTENTPMIVGLGKAADLVRDNLDRYSAKMEEMKKYLENSLISKVGEDNITILSKFPITNCLPNTTNIAFRGENCKGRAILALCPRVEASVGAACHSNKSSDSGSAIILASGYPPELAANAIRLSVGRSTDEEEIDVVVDQLTRAYFELSRQ